jgi:hypothetical protein
MWRSNEITGAKVNLGQYYPSDGQCDYYMPPFGSIQR